MEDKSIRIRKYESLIFDVINRLRNTGLSTSQSILIVFLSILANRNNQSELAGFNFDEKSQGIYKYTKDFIERELNFDIGSIAGLEIYASNYTALIFRVVEIFQWEKLTDIELLELFNNCYLAVNKSGHDATHITPPSVAKLMVELSGVSNGDSVLDLSVGSGAILDAVIRKAGGNVSFTGVDTHIESILFSKLKSYLHGYRGFDGHLQSIYSYVYDNQDSKFDVIINDPPVGKKPKQEIEYMFRKYMHSEYFTTETSINFIEIGLSALNENGKGIYLVHTGILFGLGDQQTIRESWIRRGLLRSVITLPAGLLSYTGLKCAILIFDKINDERSDTVRFIKAEDCYSNLSRNSKFIDDENIFEITNRVYGRYKDNFCNTVGYSEIINNDFNLLPDLYLEQEISGRNLNLSKIWSPIQDLAEVYRGTSLSKAKDGDEPIIQGRDIRVDRLDVSSLEYKNIDGFDVRRTEQHDILLQRIGSSPAAYYVWPNEAGIAVADTVFIIRFKDKNASLIRFVADYMNSEEVAKRINNARSYSVVQTQNLKTIRELEVPVPDDEIISLVEEMNSLEMSMKAEYEKAAQLKISLYGGYDESDFSSKFSEVRSAAEALDLALKQKDDIKYRVSNSYPFPFAYAYRKINEEREYTAIYRRQMMYGELLLSFLASVGLSLLMEHDSEIDNIEKIQEVLIVLEKSLSPGDWKDLLHKSCDLLKDVCSDAISNDLVKMWYKGNGKKLSKLAIEIDEVILKPLNDFKHYRGPSNSHEHKLESEKQAEKIDNILERISFCSRWELILVEDLDRVWSTSEHNYLGSMLKGDHPAFEQIEFVSEAPLSKEKLYLRSGNKFICLYPFISYQYNPETRRKELFSFDKVEKAGAVSLKSFDSGTSITSDEISKDFGYWKSKLVNDK